MIQIHGIFSHLSMFPFLRAHAIAQGEEHSRVVPSLRAFFSEARFEGIRFLQNGCVTLVDNDTMEMLRSMNMGNLPGLQLATFLKLTLGTRKNKGYNPQRPDSHDIIDLVSIPDASSQWNLTVLVMPIFTLAAMCWPHHRLQALPAGWFPWRQGSVGCLPLRSFWLLELSNTCNRSPKAHDAMLGFALSHASSEAPGECTLKRAS
eukprot:236520-Pelagomonas_calceolata.AAC.3